MKKFFFLLLLLTNIIFLLPKTAVAVDCTTERCTACDRCGYCRGNPAPSTWSACAQCIYGLGSSATADTNETLKVDETTNLPIAPIPGNQYTMLGCISTTLGGFETEGAASSAVKKVLDIIFSIVGGIALLTMLYGAFIIITSQNNPERLNFGKRIVYGAIVGVIFTLSSVFIINLIGSGILKIPGFGQ